MKKALITGITGQDGAYLAEYLLKLGYQVVGLKRRASSFNTDRINHLFNKERGKKNKFNYAYFDLTDSSNIIRLIQELQPDEIYNLAAQSHVRVSFDTPEYTANADGLGTLRLLEAIRILGLNDKTRFYQASTSELYGKVQEIPQNEKTPFYPRSPYAIAKLFAYWTTVNYREAYGIHASNGILFNHESPVRGETFVTRKISRAVANLVLGLQKKLYLGNLDAKRDWGHAKDYIRAMHLMLQQEKPDDYVIATGVAVSVREFVNRAFAEVGISLEYQGKHEREKGYIVTINDAVFHACVGFENLHLREGDEIIAVDPYYYRPTEVDVLVGDASKAREALGWSPNYQLEDLIREMVHSDIHLMKKEEYLKKGGFGSHSQIEDVF